MSTRCQIDFIDSCTYFDTKSKKTFKYNDRRRVYKKYDGDPSGTVPELQDFIKWGARSIGDVDLFSANFIFWGKLNAIHVANSRINKDPTKIITIPGILFHPEEGYIQSMPWSDFGITESNVILADSEYFYEVCITTDAKKISDPTNYFIEIKCYKLGHKGRSLKKLNGRKGQLIKTVPKFQVQ